jgi:hypothetical protein
MTVAVNPFPDYPVSRLDEDPDGTTIRTAVTDSIRQERHLIGNWLGSRSTPLIVAVRGDYGSGKTHLLLDAMKTLGKEIGPEQPPSFLRVATVAASPLAWYRAAIGPRLAGLPLEELIIRLYARAGQAVAARAELTDLASERLERDPAWIGKAVSDNLISSTAVEEVFQSSLREAMPDAPGDVMLALTLLRSGTTADLAMKWLSGQELAEDPARLVKLPRSIDSSEGALQVLLAVAALHRALSRTFALFVDEAEHFLRDDNEGGGQNATTLKRLLEGLAQRGAVVFVAGHWSAWDGLPDYLDRFSPPKPIDLVRLTADDVPKVIAAHTVAAMELGKEQAALIADLSGGNMRTTISLLRELFEVSAGFQQDLTLDEIAQTAESLRRRPTPQTVLLEVLELLELLGFSVEHDEPIEVGPDEPGIPFDLVAFRSGQPRVLVELRHPSHELAQADQVKRLAERMRDVNKKYPGAIGCFLSETRVDQAMRDAIPAGSAQRVLLNDVTQPDFMSDLSSQLTPLLRATDAPAPQQELDRSSLRTIRQISQLRSDQEQELDRILPEQAPPLAGKVSAARESSLSTPRSDYRDKLGVTYEELTRPTPLTSRLAHVWRPLTLVYLLIAGAGLFGTIFTAAQGEMFISYNLNPNVLDSLQYLVSFALIVTGLFMIIRDVIRVERFYEFRNSTLRSIYLRTENPEELITVNDELQKVFEVAGPRWSDEVFEKRVHVQGQKTGN